MQRIIYELTSKYSSTNIPIKEISKAKELYKMYSKYSVISTQSNQDIAAALAAIQHTITLIHSGQIEVSGQVYEDLFTEMELLEIQIDRRVEMLGRTNTPTAAFG